MKWYNFCQNNSGGYYIGSYSVWIETFNHNAANALAQEFCGVYFDGVEKGKDCACCGDRWSRIYDEDEYVSAEQPSNTIPDYVIPRYKDDEIIMIRLQADGTKIDFYKKDVIGDK